MARDEEMDGMTGAGSIILVDQLQDLGINAGDITKLKAAGIYSVSVGKSKIRYKLKTITNIIINRRLCQPPNGTCLRLKV